MMHLSGHSLNYVLTTLQELSYYEYEQNISDAY